MEVSSRNIVIGVIVSMVVGAAVDEYYFKKTETVNTITKGNDITTIIKEKKHSDGSSETDTTIVDKSKESEKVVEAAKAPDWLLQAGYGYDKGLTKVYTGSISRRILGPVFIGVWASSQESAGVSVALQF